MLGLLIVDLEHLVEFLAVIVLPGLVGIIVLVGQAVGRGLLGLGGLGVLRDLGVLGDLGGLRGLLNGLNGLGGGGGLGGHVEAAHLGQLPHLAVHLISNDIGRVLLTQTAGDEHQSFYLIDMRQHFLYGHIHNHLLYCRLAVIGQCFALHLTCKFTNFFLIINYFPEKNHSPRPEIWCHGERVIAVWPTAYSSSNRSHRNTPICSRMLDWEQLKLLASTAKA